jgi:tetratricopeptide (TPR) repeat protein
MLLSFTLGLLSKPTLVTLPFVLLLLDYWPLNRFELSTLNSDESRAVPQHSTKRVLWLILEKIPLFALSAAASVMAVIAEGEAVAPTNGSSLVERIGNPIMSYVTYLRQMVYPADLALYPCPVRDMFGWKIILALVLLVAISAVAITGRRKRAYLLVGWLWYLGMLVPMIGIIQVSSSAYADRFTYLPMIGLFVALTWAAADLCAGWRHRRMVLGSCATVILVALIFCARTQVSYWRNSELLWTHTLACTSDNYFAHNNLGDALFQKGSVDEAIVQYQTALQIKPDYAKAHNNLGCALLKKGSVDEAIAHFQKALQITPDDAEAHNNLGNALIQKGSVDEAIIQYQTALQINPDYAEACYDLGNALLKKGGVDEAIVHYQRALQINPDYAEAHYNFGCALLQKGNVDEAIAHFQKVLQINPDSADTHINLGFALLQKGRMDEAIVQYQKALEINPDSMEAHYNLGNAFLQKGRMDEAIVQYQKALQIEPDNTEALNNLAWALATSPQASLRNGNKAVALAQRANQLTGGENPTILRTLATAYAEAGRFNDAMRSAQKAIELARAAGQQDLAGQINSELKLYEMGLPFHQESK